jgi:methylmalonyl-CoA/ethylmalonyl-CoA epimerase
MNLADATIAQLLIPVSDFERGVEFYRDVLGIPFLFSAPPQMAFFDCGGVRLLVGVMPAGETAQRGSAIYFKVPDIRGVHASLKAKGVAFRAEPHVVHRAANYDLWLSEFSDPDGNQLALMSEVATAERINCPSCGSALGGRSGCQAAFDELNANAWTTQGRASMHNLVVDTYAMQHTEEYGRSAKSYIAHLTRLCCALDSPGDQKLYWSVAHWLDGPSDLVRPGDIASRGKMTIADIKTVASEDEYPDLVRQWARDVWMAYADKHAIARRWLEEARANTSRGKR